MASILASYNRQGRRDSTLTLNPVYKTARKQAQSLAFVSVWVSRWKMGRSKGVETGDRKPTPPISRILQHQGTDMWNVP